jgi:site-specific recombinase XerD
METNLYLDDAQVAAELERCTSAVARPAPDNWEGLSTDVIERFLDVTRSTREVTRAGQCGYRADLYSLETWMHGTTGHTLMTANSAELWAYFRKAIATGVEPRLLDRLLTSMQHFYAYVREAGFRDNDPAARMPQWVHRYFVPAMESFKPARVHAHG